jgi:alpha-beta hydrolase superfamily lysophospholipase
MLFFLGKGFRVIAHDRRGHGRSTQTGGGHDMDHYADDLAALTSCRSLRGHPERTLLSQTRGPGGLIANFLTLSPLDADEFGTLSILKVFQQ